MLRKILITPFIFLINLYKWVISPLMPATCRHYPTCSTYSIEALKYHGLFRGGAMAVSRIVRCNPWGTSGYDPVPRFLTKKADLKKYGIRSQRELEICNLMEDKPAGSNNFA